VCGSSRGFYSNCNLIQYFLSNFFLHFAFGWFPGYLPKTQTQKLNKSNFSTQIQMLKCNKSNSLLKFRCIKCNQSDFPNSNAFEFQLIYQEITQIQNAEKNCVHNTGLISLFLSWRFHLKFFGFAKNLISQYFLNNYFNSVLSQSYVLGSVARLWAVLVLLMISVHRSSSGIFRVSSHALGLAFFYFFLFLLREYKI
jgi:hypothetical protein